MFVEVGGTRVGVFVGFGVSVEVAVAVGVGVFVGSGIKSDPFMIY